MDDEQIKRLRNCATQAAPCKTCDMIENDSCIDTLMKQAADAIEELQKALDAVNDAHNEGYDVGYWAGRRDYEPKWIPVTERLPKDRHDVLVYAGVIFPYITVGYYDGLWKFSYNDEEIAGSADYWMPLPPAPKKEET